jgi:hypothetical protein
MVGQIAYEERLVVFADILGWKAAIADGQPDALISVIQELHLPRKTYGQAQKDHLQSLDGVKVNPLLLEVQFAAFSDNFIFSIPSCRGARITDKVSGVFRLLLSKGFLLRGAITVGDLYHEEAVVFGKALNDAVELEKHICHPGVTLQSRAVEKIKEVHPDCFRRVILKDQKDHWVVNPFVIPFEEDVGDVEPVKSFIDQNFHIRQIKSTIAGNIEKLGTTGCCGPKAKWQYIKDFIEKCILPTHPLLKEAWQNSE